MLSFLPTVNENPNINHYEENDPLNIEHTYDGIYFL